MAHSPPSVLVWKNQGSWGTGDHIHTCLVNAEGEVRWGRGTEGGEEGGQQKEGDVQKTASKYIKSVATTPGKESSPGTEGDGLI